MVVHVTAMVLVGTNTVIIELVLLDELVDKVWEQALKTANSATRITDVQNL